MTMITLLSRKHFIITLAITLALLATGAYAGEGAA